MLAHQYRFASATCIVLIVGCLKSPPSPEFKKGWGSGGPSTVELLERRNFYSVDLKYYPEYGVVYYRMKDDSPEDIDTEQTELLNCIKLCRSQIGPAYHDRILTAWDSRKQIPGPVPFRPKYVLCILRYFSKTHVVENASRVGYIFKAEELFGDIAVEELMSKGFRADSPARYLKEYGANEQPVAYDIITQYEESIDTE